MQRHLQLLENVKLNNAWVKSNPQNVVHVLSVFANEKCKLSNTLYDQQLGKYRGANHC